MRSTVTYTHKGWFGVCPVYLADIETDIGGPTVDPRHWTLEWLMDLSEAVFGVCIHIRAALDASYLPMWPIVVTGELVKPIVRMYEGGGGDDT